MRYIITAALASTPAFAEVPSVVTDIPPVHALVSEVMGDLGQPELLLAKGADEHDFQLKPSQMAAVVRADVVVWIGPELTPWLDEALAAAGDSGATVTLLGQSPVKREYGEEGHNEHADEAHVEGEHADEEHADEAHVEGEHAEGEHVEEEHHDEHGHGGIDPHVWLDPGNAEAWLDLIAAQLSRSDAENAAVYAANAAAAKDRVRALNSEIEAILAPVKGKPIVLFHDAYGYFADHYGLTVAGTIALGDAASPGAARLTELRAQIEAGGVLCIFPEVQHAPALVSQMAEGTGVKIGGAIDPVGSSLEPGPEAYGALLKGIAQTIADCAGS